MKYISTFLILLVVYLALAGFQMQELILGVVVSAIIALLIFRIVEYTIDYKFPLRLLLFIVWYLPVFIWALILANIDVARRVITPSLPLNPGFVKVKTSLQGDFAKFTLANSITLTPGTLSVDIKGDTIYVHTVDVKGTSKEEQMKAISGRFERILEVIFS